MDFDTKAHYRQSRAAWQLTEGKVKNPYSSANTHLHEIPEPNHPKKPSKNESLQVPNNPYAVNNNKRTRRLSIHASASAAAHTKNMVEVNNLPPVPSLPKIKEPESLSSQMMKDLSNATATEIDEYYKVMSKENQKITMGLKTNINENQKNILELMKDLKQTQDELIQVRITTKDLYEVLDEFRDSAERRIDLEINDDSPKTPYNQTNRKKDRSSIYKVESMWVTELQSLFKHVEGASKYVQSIPGRHILAESGRWYEINIGNGKPIKPIHFFILNDLILMATKKLSTSKTNSNLSVNNSQSRLQVVQCWSLHDTNLHILKPKENDTVSYKIRLTNKSLGFMYETDRYDHFIKVTEAFTKGKSELVKKDKMLDKNNGLEDTEDENNQLRRSLRNSGIMDDDLSLSNFKRRSGNGNGGNRHSRNNSDYTLQGISSHVHSRNRSHDFSANGKFSSFNKNYKNQFFTELKRIEDRIDEVDLETSHNKFNEAVGLLNYVEGKLSNVEDIINSTTTDDEETKASKDELGLLIDILKARIYSRKIDIQVMLSFILRHNVDKLKASELSDILEYFYNFGVLDKGILAFLQAVSNNLSNIMTKLYINVQGSTKADIANFLSNLIIVNVAVMKRTVLTYKQCIFPFLERDNEGIVDSSGLINWCIEEGNKLSQSIKRQLFGTFAVYEDPDDISNSKIIVTDEYLFNEFINVLKPQLNELKTVGINIDYLFDDILV